MAKFTCPFCLLRYSKRKIICWCPDCKTASKVTLLERLHLLRKNNTRQVKCKNINCWGRDSIASERHCPNDACNGVLPLFSISRKNLPISILGLRNSGKSVYITVMLEEFRRKDYITLHWQENKTMELHTKNVEFMYDLNKTIGFTSSGDKPIPQIWGISHGEGDDVEKYNFTILMEVAKIN